MALSTVTAGNSKIDFLFQRVMHQLKKAQIERRCVIYFSRHSVFFINVITIYHSVSVYT